MSTLKVTKGTTIEMSYTSVQQKNSETGAYANISSPDSVTFKLRYPSGTSTSITGDQIGSTNGWYAKKTLSSTGDYEWTVVVVKGTDQVTEDPERVVVTST